jgi:hypothetical protein
LLPFLPPSPPFDPPAALSGRAYAVNGFLGERRSQDWTREGERREEAKRTFGFEGWNLSCIKGEASVTRRRLGRDQRGRERRRTYLSNTSSFDALDVEKLLFRAGRLVVEGDGPGVGSRGVETRLMRGEGEGGDNA